MKAHRPPGWYRDPEDPARLRRWSGERWDTQHRTLPAWSIGSDEFDPADPTMPEGPTRHSELPAVATSTSRGSTSRRHLAPVTRHRRPPGTGDDGSWPDPARPLAGQRRWRRQPARVPFMGILAVLGSVILVLSMVAGGQLPSTSQGVLSADTAFLRAANAACTTTMGAVRAVNAPGISAAGSSGAPTRASIQRADRTLTTLGQRLVALAATSGVRRVVAEWIANWGAYVSARQGAPSAAGAATVARERRRADHFALANGLGDCTITAHPGPTVVQVP